jgi:hypothetical protein
MSSPSHNIWRRTSLYSSLHPPVTFSPLCPPRSQTSSGSSNADYCGVMLPTSSGQKTLNNSAASKIWVPVSQDTVVILFEKKCEFVYFVTWTSAKEHWTVHRANGGRRRPSLPVLYSPDRGRMRQISHLQDLQCQDISPHASPVRQLLQHTCYAHTLSKPLQG